MLTIARLFSSHNRFWMVNLFRFTLTIALEDEKDDNCCQSKSIKRNFSVKRF